MNFDVEILNEITSDVVEAFGQLLPQLSTSAAPLNSDALSAIIAAPASTVLIARAEDGGIVGTLTLAMFPTPTGIRAWVEDVVVHEAARGNGVGEALTVAALQIARDAGARTVDLTTRPSRQAAGRLYERVGFELRESRLYRYKLT